MANLLYFGELPKRSILRRGGGGGTLRMISLGLRVTWGSKVMVSRERGEVRKEEKERDRERVRENHR